MKAIWPITKIRTYYKGKINVSDEFSNWSPAKICN